MGKWVVHLAVKRPKNILLLKKLVYGSDKQCSIYSRSKEISHGENFTVKLKYHRVLWKTKKTIQELSSITVPSLAPTKVQIRLVKDNPGIIDPAIISHPSKISNLNYYNRRKNKGLKTI